VVTWLDSIKDTAGGGLSIQWKRFSLEQQRAQKENPDFKIWEQPDTPSRGILALVASQAAEYQGEAPFRRFHLAVFEAKHSQDRDIADLDVLKEIARGSGLDMTRFENDMANRETWLAIGRDHEEGREKYGVMGVPTLVFPGENAIFVKLTELPDSREERVGLFGYVAKGAVDRPYLAEFKRS
jgi:predicted DsbA family dithiol-disulfide isomerase